MLENGSEVTIVPFFSLKILNFMQSFVECKVSLADGMYVRYITVALTFTSICHSTMNRCMGFAYAFLARHLRWSLRVNG
jgi:hypothetical protein